MSRSVENRFHHFLQLGVRVVVDQLEQPRPNGGRHSENDPFRNSVNRIRLAVVSRVEKVVCRFLELKSNSKLVLYLIGKIPIRTILGHMA